ncbi:MAG: glutamate synthase subunit beta, partial [Candidatus Omnitrophica bacterium]|nr:glutamate synthase subunit beta [Candidatus Omnitrophota bacterium]
NYIPEWNDLLFNGRGLDAFGILDATNNMPEITGRICPAPCEYSCVLGINEDPVTIRENELAIIEHAFENDLVKPFIPSKRTRKKVAIIGSGPAGLSCAVQMNRAGHKVVVFEKDDSIGGILRYGIPDFKLEKSILERRIALWSKEGVKFVTNTSIGKDYSVSKAKKEFDCLCLACGSRVPRDLNIPGRNLKGIYFAMDFLIQSNRIVASVKIPKSGLISLSGKKVLVIGGGDTGADCVGVAHRMKASCVTQIEIMPKPAECRSQEYPWPKYPLLLKTSSSHIEGGDRFWSINTKNFVGENGRVKKVECSRVKFVRDELARCMVMQEEAGSSFEIETDCVILALGFLHAERQGLVNDLGLQLDACGNVITDNNFMTTLSKVYSAGDMRRGQSLIVHAIAEGRRAAHCMDRFLMGKSVLPMQ